MKLTSYVATTGAQGAYAFSVPILLLVFAFITLVAGLTVNGQRNEIAVLRSRGASALQVMSISFIEAIVLAILALATGIPLAQGIAQLVGQARSFLVMGEHLAALEPTRTRDRYLSTRCRERNEREGGGRRH